jgi:CoA:oxalate CoA-transferase
MTHSLLEGVRVLDLGRYTAGPYCAKQFADAGAEVVHVERPGAGDPGRGLGPMFADADRSEVGAVFAFLNSDKRSATLDFTTRTGAAWLRELLAWADVLVENFAPGTLERHGFGHGEIARVNPALVHVAITNFGRNGPHRDYRGTSLTLQAAAGLLDGNGDEEREPLRYPRHLAEYWAGANAAQAAMVARWHARRTGEGQLVDVSIVESIAATYFSLYAAYEYHGALQARGQRDLYETADGQVLVQWQTSVPWDVFALTFEAEELALDPQLHPPLGMIANSERFRSTLGASLRRRASSEWFARARELKIPAGMLQSPDEVLACEHLEARGFFDLATLPGGQVGRFPGAPYTLHGEEPAGERRVPGLGADNAVVFGDWLGHTPKELQAARDEGAI